MKLTFSNYDKKNISTGKHPIKDSLWRSRSQLNINSCKSNSTTQKPLLGSGMTLMKVFAESFNFQAVRGSSVGVSYSRWDLSPPPQYLAADGWFKNWEYIGQPVKRPAFPSSFKFTDTLFYRIGGMK